MSGADTAAPLVVLPAALEAVLGTLGALTAPDMPAVAVIGGMAVNIRLSTADEAHRATQDVDVVADDDVPSAVEVLARDHELAGEHTVVVKGVEVDVIETQPVSDEDLVGIDDGARLFVAGHRWALDTAGPVRLTTVGGTARTIEVPVAAPAGLVATKSHAAGYARAERRVTKRGGDLYDLFRLVEVFDARGELRAVLAEAPGSVGLLVAQVVKTEILSNPARAMRQMGPAASTAPDVDQIVDVMEPFVADLG